MRVRREFAPGTHAPPSACLIFFASVFDRRKVEFYHRFAETVCLGSSNCREGQVALLLFLAGEQTAAAVLVSMLDQVVTIALAIAVIVGGIEVVKGVYDLLIKNKSRPLSVK
jgi:hypothetical protein